MYLTIHRIYKVLNRESESGTSELHTSESDLDPAVFYLRNVIENSSCVLVLVLHV